VTFPNFTTKHTADSTPLVTADRFVRHLQERGLLEGYVAPKGIVLLYQPAFAKALLQREPHRASLPYPDFLFLLQRVNQQVGVLAFFGIGAPAVTALVETLVALGTRRFVSMGVAGGLQPDGQVGDIVVCDGAVRDEGVSHHYLPPMRMSYPSRELTAALCRTLKERGHRFTAGVTWTIDAPYCETVEELRHYRDEGVLTVEMEAAALFAVAQRRGFEIGSAFVLSDTLTEAEWVPDFGAPAIKVGLDKLVDVAIDVLL
jgi:uridine phosphorylase